MSKERLEQTQQLRLQQRINPQHVALGRVLEMTAPEFEEEVRRELDENPALEVVDNISDGNDFNESSAQLQNADYADEDDMPTVSAYNRSADDPIYDATAMAADDDDSLMRTLMSRLRSETDLTPQQLLIAEYVVGNLDSNGYLTRTLNAIAADIGINEGFMPSDVDVKNVTDVVRSLDPAGICATDLRDCLLLQLDRRQADSTVAIARKIIGNYFDLFSKRHFERLQSELAISRDKLAEAMELIRTLNPRPGATLSGGRSDDKTRHISPDFTLDYDETNDRFTLTLLSNVPELTVEESFRVEPNTPNGGSESLRRRRNEADEYIRRRRESALNFIALAAMRTRTLMNIGHAIVDIQHRFFASGDSADIRPMVLRDVAERTSIDISTVSRAVAGKYILTSHGIYSLRSLFGERPTSDSDTSTPAILKLLGEIIATEDKTSPLSDRELCDILAERGYEIARRTIAKYRERLGLPVARLRKQL